MRVVLTSLKTFPAGETETTPIHPLASHEQAHRMCCIATHLWALKAKHLCLCLVVSLDNHVPGSTTLSPNHELCTHARNVETAAWKGSSAHEPSFDNEGHCLLRPFFFPGVASLTNTSSLSKGPHDRWPGCHGRAHTENQRRPQPCHLIGVGSSEGKYTGTRRPRRFKQLYVNSCSCQIWQLLGWPTFLCQLQSETRLLPKVETRGLLGQACLYLLEWLHTSKRPSGLFLSSFSLSVTFSPTHFPALFCQILSALHVKNIP